MFKSVNLVTTWGEAVATVAVLTAPDVVPDVVLWGTRVFVRTPDATIYREGLAAAAVEDVSALASVEA